MSPEVALLVRAALLGLFVFALERFSRRRQARHAATRNTSVRSAGNTILPELRYSSPLTLTGRPVQLEMAQSKMAQSKMAQVKVVQRVSVSATQPAQPDILRFEPRTVPAYVTEKRAA